jgi:hypothetical protein
MADPLQRMYAGAPISTLLGFAQSAAFAREKDETDTLDLMTYHKRQLAASGM